MKIPFCEELLVVVVVIVVRFRFRATVSAGYIVNRYVRRMVDFFVRSIDLA